MSPTGDTRIRAVRATPVKVPLSAPYRWSFGLYGSFSHTIVEMESDDGVVGLGETCDAVDAHVINEMLAPRLVGLDPLDFAACERAALVSPRVAETLGDRTLIRAYGGIEIALWDLVGRIEERSVASLLGGRVRDSVSFSEYFAFRVGQEESASAVAAYCGRMKEEHSSTTFEGKVGVHDIQVERRMLTEVRRAIGEDALLRVDANMKWTVPTARQALSAFAPAGVAWVEEPVRTFSELVRLRQTCGVSFSMHEPNFPAAVGLGVPEALVVNVDLMGGIRRTADFARACGQFGIEVWFRSPITGVGQAAVLQVAAAVQELEAPSQSLVRWQSDDVINEGPFLPTQGCVAVPNGPGLGVTLDQKALARCHERYATNGAE